MSINENTKDIVIAMINNGFLNVDADKQKKQLDAVCEAITKIRKTYQGDASDQLAK